MNDPTEPRRRGRGRPPGSKNRPNPESTPLPPRPAEIGGEIVGCYWRIAETRAPNWYGKSRRRDALNDLIRYAVQHVPDGTEISVKTVRTILAAWGLPAESRLIDTPIVTRALGDADRLREPVSLDIGGLGRRQILQVVDILSAVPTTGAPPDLRAALLAAALAAVLQESGTTSFAPRDLDAAINYEAKIAGIRYSTASKSTLVLLQKRVGVVKLLARPTRVDGDRVKNIERLVNYSEQTLKTIKREHPDLWLAGQQRREQREQRWRERERAEQERREQKLAEQERREQERVEQREQRWRERERAEQERREQKLAEQERREQERVEQREQRRREQERREQERREQEQKRWGDLSVQRIVRAGRRLALIPPQFYTARQKLVVNLRGVIVISALLQVLRNRRVVPTAEIRAAIEQIYNAYGIDLPVQNPGKRLCECGVDICVGARRKRVYVAQINDKRSLSDIVQHLTEYVSECETVIEREIARLQCSTAHYVPQDWARKLEGGIDGYQ